MPDTQCARCGQPVDYAGNPIVASDATPLCYDCAVVLSQTVGIMHRPLYFRRVAVRDGDGQPWRWFSPPIGFSYMTVRSETAFAVLEDSLVEAVFKHPTHHIRVFEAASSTVFDRLDLTNLADGDK